MNPLEQNPRARQIAYQVFWVVSLIVGATQVGFLAADTDVPTALTVALAVLPFVGAAIGYTAQANVTAAPIVADPEQVILVDKELNTGISRLDELDGVGRHRDETGAYDTGSLLIVLACLVIIACNVVFLVRAF